jgi:sugar lactone lactonase YvrE
MSNRDRLVRLGRSVVVALPVLLVFAPGAAIRASAPPAFCERDQIGFELDIEFGAADEDDAGFLYIPASVVVDSSGNVFVLDHAQQSIVKFDRQGNHVRSFSREGEGPGELRSAFQLAIAPDGEVVAYDPGNRRISFFDNDGGFLRSVSLAEMGYDFVAGLEVGADGTIYMETHHVDITGKRDETAYAIKRFSPDLKNHTVVDSIHVKDNTYITKPIRSNVPVPFPPALFWDIGPSGHVVVGHSEDYTLKIFSAAGKLLKTFQHEGTRLEVTDEDREEHFSGVTMADSSGHVSRGAPSHIRKATKFPRYKPHFRGLKIDTEGNILIGTYETEEGKVAYDVFTPDGRFACRVKLPAWFQSSVLAGGDLYRIETSDDGSAFVRRYRRTTSVETGP